MRSTQIQNYQMFIRVVEFMAGNASLFPKSTAAAEILKELQSTVADLSKQASAQVASDGELRECQVKREVARQTLARRLALYEKVARALDVDKFKAPGRHRDHDLISTAHAFVENGESMSQDFSRHALPLKELTAGVEELERANADWSTAKARRVASVREFAAVEAQAMGYVMRLEAIVEITLADNPSAIASWTVARTVQRAAVRKREVKPPDPPAQVPAAA